MLVHQRVNKLITMPELFITSGVIKHGGPLELPELAMEVIILAGKKQKRMGDLNMVWILFQENDTLW